MQVDALLVLRPNLADEQIAEAISRGLTHADKHYDFVFDFSKSDRLACTEVVYRSYHGVGEVSFELQSRAGRHCLSAEDLINQAVKSGSFEPVLIYGVQGDNWLEGDAMLQGLRETFDAVF